MSYLVLARKWRPRRFAELVGQEHVVRALTNALDSGRVHHAFLFTGTRGVGKTTIARIFAKSLNCEQGTSAEPCGVCGACVDIDAGRFMDLLEIDAASNTGVDDVREVIENAQYMPSRGRTKVYLIDEVHMLSKAAFNALLKTLEEPPGHVKFLLATTDPQKLPVTVLSRCLQFNLKRLDEAQISGQMTKILEAEGIPVEAGALRQLAKAADGSLRDGLSLLDQAIAYTGGQLGDAAVASMLGTVDRTRVGAVLGALAEGDGTRLMAEVAALAEFSPDWGSVLEAMGEALHRVQVRQLVPEVAVEADGVDVDALAAQLRPELVQLWYQMALSGRRDLPFAPSPRVGFEMSVLRMLAFRPAGDGTGAGTAGAAPAAGRGDAAARAATALTGAPPPSTSGRNAAAVPARAGATEAAPKLDTASPVSPSRQHSVQSPDPGLSPPTAHAVPRACGDLPPGPVALAADAVSTAAAQVEAVLEGVRRESDNARVVPAETHAPGIADADAWLALVAGSGLKGPARVLAEHAGFIGYADGVLRLALSPEDELLGGPATVKLVADALTPVLGRTPQIRFEAAPVAAPSLRERNERARDERQSAAEQAFMGDPEVQRLVGQHGARIVPDSIRPLDTP